MGHPIGHSLSPAMHGAALARLAEEDPRYRDWSYVAVDAEPSRLGEALALLGERGYRGVNLTVPHKVLAVSLAARLDPAARDAGAVNTLLREAGAWSGFNTDGYGLAEGLREDLGISLRGIPVVVIGAGGAARGAAAECLRAGCSGIWIQNRTPAHLYALVAALRRLAGPTPVSALWRFEAIPAGALIINATSVGLRPDDPSAGDLEEWPTPLAVYDMIYNPPETPLLAQARGLGLRCANGLGMLVHQGAKALEIWTGVPAARTAPWMREAAVKALG